MIESNAKVNVKRFPTERDAREAANAEASATGSIVLPAVMFQQGNRRMLSTAFQIPVIRNRLQLNSAEKRGSVEQVRSATNRPTMPEHVDSVKNYLKENVGGRYIIPPMTLNVRQPMNVYMPDYPSTLISVYLVLPSSARLEITDGGHRKAAIDKTSNELTDEHLAQFDQDAVAVMITIEDDMSQIHQDFADCSKTKPLPKSQLAAYDRRNPANGLVLDLIEHCPIFTGKIDSTSKTLSSRSASIFLTNQVRQMVKEMLVGDYALADDAFEQKAKDLLGSSEDPRYVTERKKFVDFINRVTAANPIWKEIAALPDGTPRNRITDLRNEGHVNLTATGLVVMGRIAHELFKNNVAEWTEYADKLGAVDWRRNAPIWQGNVIQSGKVMTQRSPVRDAVTAVRSEIGLAPTTVKTAA